MRHHRGSIWLAIFWCAATACLAPATDPPSAASPARAEIVPRQAYIQIGDTFQFQLQVEGSDPHAPRAPHEEPLWWVSDPTIAQIDSASGLVVGKRSGSVMVSAMVRGTTASAQVAIAPAILVGAGDIAACASSGDEATAALLDIVSGTVFTVGDNVYESGTYDEFTHCYEPSWGRHRARTRPSPGNHEYRTPGAAGYFAYFGDAAGDPSKGYYSYDLGRWHVIALNSTADVRRGSPQEQWLQADLAAHPALCTLAYWHYPRFSSGWQGSIREMEPIWQTLYDAGADVVISAHDHHYERFAPQTPSGLPDSVRGIRQFVVGTGGKSLLALRSSAANSEVRDNSTFGVLLLKLYDDSYEWEFVPASRDGFTDAGADRCH